VRTSCGLPHLSSSLVWSMKPRAAKHPVIRAITTPLWLSVSSPKRSLGGRGGMESVEHESVTKPGLKDLRGGIAEQISSYLSYRISLFYLSGFGSSTGVKIIIHKLPRHMHVRHMHVTKW
jgi:hypothetical protein